MRKINKITNIALIFTLIGILLCAEPGFALRVPHQSDSYLGKDRLENAFKENFRLQHDLKEVFWGKKNSLKKLKQVPTYQQDHIPTIHTDASFFTAKKAEELIREEKAVIVRTKGKNLIAGELKLALINPLDAHLLKDGAETIVLEGFTLDGEAVILGKVELDREKIDEIYEKAEKRLSNDPDISEAVKMFANYKTEDFKDALIYGSYNKKHQALTALIARQAAFSGRNMPRREMLKKTFWGLVAATSAPYIGLGQPQSSPRSAPRSTQNVFGSAETLASIGSPGFKYDNIAEEAVARSIHILTDLDQPVENKIIRWKWSQAGDAWSASKWDGDRETLDLSMQNLGDLVFRFVVSGTVDAVYKIIFEDASGRKIELLSTDYLRTLAARQYILIRLDALESRDPAFDWSTVKPVRLEAVSPTGAMIFIKKIEILNVKSAREKGIGIGLFYEGKGINGNNFPALDGYTGEAIPGGRIPASVISFSDVGTRDPQQMIQQCNNLHPGQIPHEVGEFWPALAKPSSMTSEQFVEILRAEASERKKRILSGKKISELRKRSPVNYVFKPASGEPTVLERIINGEFDAILAQRAQAIAGYGKPFLFRPLQEMMGGWYAWSVTSKKDADDFIAAWRHIVTIYRDNGATNVGFVFSPHTYEPETLPQTRNYQLLDYILSNIQEDVDAIAINAYSYPPYGGYSNELITGLIDVLGKYDIPMITGEMSSAMDIADKYNFWNYLRTDLKNGMFYRLTGLGIFSIEKWEEGGMKNFYPPEDTMREWEMDGFFAPNPFATLPLWETERIDEPTPALPQDLPIIYDWVANNDSYQRFTMLPNGEIEECFWIRWNENTWSGHGRSLACPGLSNSNYSDFEFALPLEVFEGDFRLIFEDSTKWPDVGNQIIIHSDKLTGYIKDGMLIMPLSEIAKIGTFDTGNFDWEYIMQVKFEILGQRGRILRGTPIIRKIDDTAVDDWTSGAETQVATNIVDLEQNYPNPFGPYGTSIRYTINKHSDDVRIKVFDILGRTVREIDNLGGSLGSNILTWDGNDDAGNPLPNGTYLLRIIIDGKPEGAIKMIKLSTLMGIGMVVNEERPFNHYGEKRAVYTEDWLWPQQEFADRPLALAAYNNIERKIREIAAIKKYPVKAVWLYRGEDERDIIARGSGLFNNNHYYVFYNFVWDLASLTKRAASFSDEVKDKQIYLLDRALTAMVKHEVYGHEKEISGSFLARFMETLKPLSREKDILMQGQADLGILVDLDTAEQFIEDYAAMRWLIMIIENGDLKEYSSKDFKAAAEKHIHEMIGGGRGIWLKDEAAQRIIEKMTEINDIFSDKTLASNMSLSRRTEEIRDYYKRIKRIIEENDLMTVASDFIKGERPDLEPVLGIKEPRERLLALLSNVARITKKAAGHDFDLAVYFASGSDLLTIAQFSDNIVTFDRNDIFYASDLWNDESLRNQLLPKLVQKLSTGTHASSEIRTLTEYATELFLLEVDPDSLNVLEEKNLGENKSFITVEFEAAGRKIAHTHFRYIWDEDLGEEDSLPVNKLCGLMKDRKIVVLSKAGRMYKTGPNYSVSTIYPLLPDGAIIVSDVDKARILNIHAPVEDLKLNDPNITKELRALEDVSGFDAIPISRVISSIPKKLGFGYAVNLEDINFYRVKVSTENLFDKLINHTGSRSQL